MSARRLEVEPFTLAVPEWELDDLRRRVVSTRWPSAAPGTPWEQGTDLTYLRELLHHWAHEFDWRAQERKLNGFNHFRVGPRWQSKSTSCTSGRDTVMGFR